jgi:hypothetical protein
MAKAMTNEEAQQQQLLRGTNDDEYQIYVSNAKNLGWTVKSYDEWLDS